MFEKTSIPEKLTKRDLLKILKKEASKISIKDIMDATIYLREETKYMPVKEREEFIKRFTKAFFNRMRDVKNEKDRKEYNRLVNTKKLGEFIEFLDEQLKNAKNKPEKCFQEIARIISVYATFIREEPIHPVGTRFPGGLMVKKRKNVYYCPVKEKQMDTPGALCRFCVSVQDPDVI
ncbi:DUF2115 domain-containing protein [Methanothermobacter tenebrarum]|uniref:UPF0305 protein DPC56_03805 n=1 Tax=Methanothermobacter tenebrarum TaxID=680118 RepID=A0A328PAZ2_9EURY|nr:DUF2115 domain-containing protein [Methanothermobacter tenebrarum]MBC7100077.1 DUF2115 domain-containing protein [Methanobacteriales archaeon]NPV64866.1 DUF2115 domain-containing protein [Methanobacteriaceae archaeon]RAO79439.1 hypothetical protein DPC56_03805 [Methanothermobacter tenebrarum]